MLQKFIVLTFVFTVLSNMKYFVETVLPRPRRRLLRSG